ncbi:hypothetical protein BU204_32800 [Actinophytocola xanthii]|uniref:SCP domain-containing protein n=1 Tax=Actinophytocola xanthii TaxID=1912961 RepID=A0A1Q8C5J3_9PSEU|nr:hypothetical protein BU204_32800 [Actinophytocola xanthii]
MLPALSAALVGALTAGAATFMTDAESVADAGQVNLAVENSPASDPGLSDSEDPTGALPAESADEQTYEQNSSTVETVPASTTQQPTSTPSEAPSSPSSEAPAPPPATGTPTQVTEEEQVVTLVNAARAQSGCDPVTTEPELVEAAQQHSSDMSEREYFDHTTPEGLTFADRILEAGYESPGAENIARGQTSATQVMNSWMESDGHRANILNCQLTTIGVGLDKDGWYWTQNFGY